MIFFKSVINLPKKYFLITEWQKSMKNLKSSLSLILTKYIKIRISIKFTLDLLIKFKKVNYISLNKNKEYKVKVI
jgi:hypothetical protein